MQLAWNPALTRYIVVPGFGHLRARKVIDIFEKSDGYLDNRVYLNEETAGVRSAYGDHNPSPTNSLPSTALLMHNILPDSP